MFRVMPSLRVRNHPLQGLNSLGAVVSYYRIPYYSCVTPDEVKEAAVWACLALPSSQTSEYRSKSHPTRFKTHKEFEVGEPGYDYRFTLSDVKSGLLNPCDIAKKRVCKPLVAPAPSAPGQPKQTNTPAVVPPPVQTAPPPATSPVPTPTSTPTPPQQAPPQMQAETPVLVVPTSVPQPTQPRQQPTTTAVQPYPPQYADDSVEITGSEYSEPAAFVEEDFNEEESLPEEDNSNVYVVGGIVLLVAGGGLAYYLSTRKKRRR